MALPLAYASSLPQVSRQQKQASRGPRPLQATTQERPRTEAGIPQGVSQLEALKQYSLVVADTGEIESIRKYKPVDSTTNPSLLLKAVQNPQYEHFLNDAVEVATQTPLNPERPYAEIADVLAVNVGMELLKIVPGRVSTEVDAHLSYDTKATVDKALSIVDLYSKKGQDLSRIYIKIASTWEGIRACEQLQKQGIDTNMTLLFSFAQACAAADAGAALISPFVGRIMDWYKKKEGHEFSAVDDPGVKSVQKIYRYYKEQKYQTIVMAASFRNVGEIQELAGCDNITISPPLLAELDANHDPLPRKLWPSMGGQGQPRVDMTAPHFDTFKKMHGEDQMAVDKLKEGIDSFAADAEKLEVLIGKLKGK